MDASTLVAVAICTAGRPEPLRRLLAHLARIEPLPPGFSTELILVDNRPGTGAAPVAEAARPGLPMPLVLVLEPTPGLSFARNRAVAVALARGAGLLAFLDDDDLPEPGWLARLLETHLATGADMVFGGHRLAPGIGVPAWLERVGHLQEKPRPELNPFGIPAGAATCNVLLSRALLVALAAEGEPFRRQFSAIGGEDTDLFIRAARRGFAFAVCRESRVMLLWEPERLGLRGLTRRSFRQGVARWHLRCAHAAPVRRWAELRRLGGEVLRRTLRLATALHRPRRLARTYLNLVEQLGELHALCGGSFAYYASSRHPPDPRTKGPR